MIKLDDVDNAELLQTVIENSPSGVAITDYEGNILDVNKQYSKILGYSKKELLRLNCKELTKNKYTLQEILTKINKIGALSKIKKTCLKKDGNEVIVEMSISYLTLNNKYIIIINSLDETIKLKKTLTQSNAFFNNSSIGFLVVDKNRMITDANPMLCKMLGYHKKELIKQSIQIIYVDNKDYEEFEKIAFEKIYTGLCSTVDFPLKHKNNTMLMIEISGSFVEDNILWSYRDITERLRQREELRQLNKTLEIKIQQEVAKNLEKEKEFQNQRLNDIKFATIGKLAAGITHEINTPLTYIKGNLEMMKFDIDDMEKSDIKSNLLQSMKSIEDGILRLTNTTEAMREVSKIKTKKNTNTNIYSTLITAVTMANNRAKHISNIYINNKLFKIEMDKNEYNFLSYSDSFRIEQVWMIIINNALDELVKIELFEERKLSIKIRENKNEIIVTFEDNAGGIDPVILPNIFHPLTSTKDSHGIGIGLNIAKSIISDQKGSLTAKNINNGALFTVKIPKEEIIDKTR